MPEVNERGIDVSKEEERYLRRTFRRFALPYVAALAVFAWAVSSWPGDAAPPELGSLGQDLETALASIAALEQRVEATSRVAEQAGRQAAAASKRGGAGTSSAELEKLEGELRAAQRRIAQLEAKLQDKGAHARIDALSDRIGRVERNVDSIARSEPAPRPVPAAPAPAAPPTATP